MTSSKTEWMPFGRAAPSLRARARRLARGSAAGSYGRGDFGDELIVVLPGGASLSDTSLSSHPLRSVPASERRKITAGWGLRPRHLGNVGPKLWMLDSLNQDNIHGLFVVRKW